LLSWLGATADQLSNGRFAVNVVSGWFKDEFTHLGEPWLDFYRVHDITLEPKPVNTPERPTPEIVQGGTRPPRAATAVATPTGTSPTARISTG
jgi:FMNH2-dependent dimethyl sulfone monooxygenase